MSDEDDNMCRPNSYGVNGEKFPDQNTSYPRNVGNSYVDDYNNEGEDEEDEEDVNDDNDDNGSFGCGDDDDGDGVPRRGKDDYKGGDEDNTSDDDTDDDASGGGLERLPKKRKLKTLMSSYEFAPRLLASSSVSASASAQAPKPSYGGRNPLMDWTEHETSILLDAWGERYLKQGRKSLRSEEWQEVSEKVSQESQIERTDTQCRNRLDTLKKKYKKEKMKLGENGDNVSCKWSYFNKMNMLLSSLPQQADLPCGMESGEYVFANPEVYLNQSNGLDEMRDSPGNSESAGGGGGEDELEGIPQQRGQLRGNAASFKMLADSIHKFSEIYKKIEDRKRQQMVELEKMRMDFHRDLDFEKRQILERAQAEIQKIGQGDDDAPAAADHDDNEASAENASG